MRFSIYCPRTPFSLLSFKFSSFTFLMQRSFCWRKNIFLEAENPRIFIGRCWSICFFANYKCSFGFIDLFCILSYLLSKGQSELTTKYLCKITNLVFVRTFVANCFTGQHKGQPMLLIQFLCKWIIWFLIQKYSQISRLPGEEEASDIGDNRSLLHDKQW